MPIRAVQRLRRGQAQARGIDMAHSLRAVFAHRHVRNFARTHGEPVAVFGQGKDATFRVGVERAHAIAGHGRKAHRIVHIEIDSVEAGQAIVGGNPEEAVGIDPRGTGATDRQAIGRAVMALHPRV